jgi:MFS transporter, OFA family, oxalate/formate antiporter
VRRGEDHQRYYGWTVARAAFAVLAVTYGLQYTFGVMIPEIEKSTGWSRTQLSGLYSVYLLAYVVFGAVTGRLCDRIGPRRVIAIGGVLFGLGWLTLAVASDIWMVVIGFCGVAAMGMSASFVPCSATVIKWFTVRRGAALSLAISGAGLGGLLSPLLANWLMSLIGWRATLAGLSVMAGLIVVVASRWMAASPEAMGIDIVGELNTRAEPTRTQRDLLPYEAVSWTLRDARRTLDFWIIGAVFLTSWLVAFVPVVHLVAFVTTLGASSTTASIALSAIGLGGLLGRLLSGPIADRVGVVRMLVAMLLIQVAVYLVFALSGNVLVIIVFAVIFGCGYGGTVTMFPAVVGSRFGRLNSGAISGALLIGSAAAAAVGPVMAGVLYDRTGGYSIVFLVGMAANVVAALLGGALYRRIGSGSAQGPSAMVNSPR